MLISTLDSLSFEKRIFVVGLKGLGKLPKSSNLSAIIAQSGKRVLLVDADLRRGFIHRKFSSTLGLG